MVDLGGIKVKEVNPEIKQNKTKNIWLLKTSFASGFFQRSLSRENFSEVLP